LRSIDIHFLLHLVKKKKKSRRSDEMRNLVAILLVS
jgi:hypothetical protein